MHAIAAFSDDLANFVETIVRCVIRFERTTRYKAGANDGRKWRRQRELYIVVERAVDKNKAVRIRHLSALDPDIGK
jgi:hypothetical protein